MVILSLRWRLYLAQAIVPCVGGYIWRRWLIFAMAVDPVGPMPRNPQRY